MIEKEELRKKIKQLKYKIQKEEHLNKELDIKVRTLKQLQAQQLGSDRVFKKISFKLREKGMDLNDWINCLPYDQPFHIDDLLKIGDSLGLHLDRQERDFMINFMANDLSLASSPRQFEQECRKRGIRLS